MSKELVERLRKLTKDPITDDGEYMNDADDAMYEAADEIERLNGIIEEMSGALKKIERWHGEFPPTGQYWDDKTEMSYETCFGAYGARDFMREVARTVLSKAHKVKE